MSGELLCPFCGEATDGLTLYSVGGVFRLMVCQACYGLLVVKERQPHSQPMQRLHRLLGCNGRWWTMRVEHDVTRLLATLYRLWRKSRLSTREYLWLSRQLVSHVATHH